MSHAGSCLRHRRYQMDCAEFVALLAALGDGCGICRIPGPEARPAYLLIDHDHKLGPWAVRGMLCSGCNRRIRDGVTPPAEAGPYLASPWYLRKFIVASTLEMAAIFGVSRQWAGQIINRPDFPKPYDVLHMGKVWRRSAVEAWARDHGRAFADAG